MIAEAGGGNGSSTFTDLEADLRVLLVPPPVADVGLGTELGLLDALLLAMTGSGGRSSDSLSRISITADFALVLGSAKGLTFSLAFRLERAGGLTSSSSFISSNSDD